MGCSPSLLFDHKRRRGSDGSQEAALAKVATNPICNKVSTRAPRASLESDGFSIQLSSKKDSYVSQMGSNFATQLHIKRISGSSSGSPGARGRRSSLALTPEDEPLIDVTNRSSTPTQVPSALLYAPPEALEVLCVFGERSSRVCAAAAGAASGSAGGSARAVRGSREALDALRSPDTRQPHIIVIDARHPHLLDAILLARTIRGMKNTQHIILIAVVKKSTYLKEEQAVLPYLEAGFNRVMVETVSVCAWRAELSMSRAAAVGSRAAHAALAALVAAADRCRDLVAVTDDTHRILMTNKAWTRTLGWRTEDGKEGRERALSDTAGGEAVRLAGAGLPDWEAPLTLRRRTAPEVIVLPCRAATVTVSRSPSHAVFVCEASGLLEVGPGLSGVRRGSLDVRSVASDTFRRTSLAKLQGLPLEAPITKVISLLSAAAEGAPPATVACIERAAELLRTCELYSPQMRDDTKLRPDDPIATDLIGALLSQGPTNLASSRRSSNDSTAVRSQPTRPNLKHKASGQVRELLDSALSWEFDVFRLEEASRGRPLAHAGLTLCARLGACAALDCDERTLLHWLTVIESNYHSTNTYHNSTHAADVLQAVAHFLEKERLKTLLEPLEVAAALISAAAHDVDHPGTSSAFLCNARHPLAILYNDISVLESHHSALTFKLTLNDDRMNIFKNLERDTYKAVRHDVVDMILATEMTKHFEHLAKFVNVFYAKSSSKEEDINTDEPLQLDTSALQQPENVVLVKRMMIKCADVSNASRPLKFAMEWARRIAEEYFLQTDKEKAKDLPVVMPMFDRATCSVPRSQIGFIDYIIIDMMEAWAAFIDMPELVTHARANHQRWRELDEAGVTTAEDVRKTQRQLPAPTPATNIASTAAKPTAEE